MKKRNARRRSLLAVVLCLCCMAGGYAQQPDRIDISGTWRFQLDPMGFGKTPGSELYKAKLAETILLPGSTDQGGKGVRTTARYVDRLTRKFEYCGMAWYQREVCIPQAWEGKVIRLFLERCHWETGVYVDGNPVSWDERLSTPNRFVLSKQLTPGVHTLTLCVDNRLKYPMDQWNHGTTEYTQTNWNGVVGRMELQAVAPTYAGDVSVYPDVDRRRVTLRGTLYNEAGQAVEGKLRFTVREKQSGRKVGGGEQVVALANPETAWTQVLELGKDMHLWDEFSPFLYEVETRLETGTSVDVQTDVFGMRKLEQGIHHIRLNNRNIHLRGALDCAVFPLTGYPATDVQSWKRIFTTVKAYGLNHIRFHSWCPPEAAFCAADEVGLYLQAELPMWIKDVGSSPARRDFFEKEMRAILQEYGNHPSFLLFCNGNENEGNFAVLEELIQKGQQLDGRHLYSASTARTHTASDQFYVSHVTSKGGITVYEGIPSTLWDKRKEHDIDVPAIAHESGQRCMYPNFDEMKKYTGVLEPRNFEVFRERLARNGMLHQAGDFFRATGRHTVLQYKEVNESLLRTPNSAGFHLLGLSDFPGQGSAFVGILDAFWESKGLVSPEKYRESCAPVVLLARFAKRAYTSDEVFEAQFDVYQYGPDALPAGRLRWTLEDESGRVYRQGTLRTPRLPVASVDSVGSIQVRLDGISSASRLVLRARLGDTLQNEWNIWVYPPRLQANTAGYLYATTYGAEVRKALAEGRRVLLVPDEVNGRKTHFASHFWNPIMFNWNPMIVGTLIQAGHPVFRDFPTDSCADWQWWDVLNHAKAMDLTAIRQLTPVIQSIDTYEYNQKLGIAFEARVGKGRLFVLSVDTKKQFDQRPATRQLLHAVRNYVADDIRFNPACTLQPYELDALFETVPAAGISQKGESAAVKQLLNQ